MTDRKIAEAFPPGEFIKEELEIRNWSQIELAEIIGRQPSVVSELIMGKRPISPEIAKALGNAFGTTAQYWMNLEVSYQLWRIQDTDEVVSRRAKLYQIAPIKEMIKRHWLEPSENIEVLEKRIIHFFEINNLDEPIWFDHAARRKTQEILPSHHTWLFRAKQLAYAVTANAFSNKSFKDALAQLKKILPSLPEIRRIPKVLAESGIRFIILEHLPHTKIDGVTFWLNEKSPVIVLSLRYDRIDWFWFTLAHELGHIERRDGLKNHNIPILDTDLVGDEVRNLGQITDSEKQVDSFATEFLVACSELNDFISRKGPLYGTQKIIGFANRIGVHPGIIVGQLHHRGEIEWNVHRKMLDKVKHIITQSALTDGWGQVLPILNSKETKNDYVH